MAAAPLPAARQITRPLGPGGRCCASTTPGLAAATAASKIARNRGRRSVMGSRTKEMRNRSYPSLCSKRKPPRLVPRGRSVAGEAELAADVGGDDVAEQLPLLALEAHQL